MSEITKNALRASLKRLLQKKPLNKITVSDITNDCGLNRMTFYYHFKDIYDLIESLCLTETNSILKEKNDIGHWDEGLLEIFNAVLENKHLIMNVFRSVGHEQTENFLCKLLYDMIIDVINERSEGVNISEEDKSYIADFYKYAFAGIMLKWIKNDMKESPKSTVERLKRTIDGSIDRMMENCKK